MIVVTSLLLSIIDLHYCFGPTRNPVLSNYFNLRTHLKYFIYPSKAKMFPNVKVMANLVGFPARTPNKLPNDNIYIKLPLNGVIIELHEISYLGRSK